MRLRADVLENVAALGVALIAAVAASSRILQPNVFQSDALIHQYWMRRFVDPALFHDGLTAALLESERYPEGYRGLFWVAARFADPVAFGEWLGVALMAISGWLVFRIVREHTAWRPAAWIAGGTFLALSDIHRFAGGFPRGFVHPLVLLVVLLALRGKMLAPALVAGGGALLYPPAALLSVGLLLVCALRWRSGRPRIDRRRAGFALLGLASMVAVVLVPQVLSGSSSDVLTGAQARALPEFGRDGPLRFFVPSTLEYLKQNRSGFDLRGSGSIAALAALALLVVRPANLRLVRREVLALPVSALGAFALAHLVLFRLYLPHRYTYALLPFFAIVIGVALRPTWEAVWTRRRSWPRAVALLCGPIAIYLVALYLFPLGPTRSLDRFASWATLGLVAVALAVAVAVTLVLVRMPQARRPALGAVLTGVILLGTLLSLPGRRPGGKACPPKPVYAYLTSLPKDAVLASDPNDTECVPIAARRPVVISMKHAPTYEAGYFREARARLLATLDAYYGRTPQGLVDLRRRYGATHVWVRRAAVAEEMAPDGMRWRWRGGRRQPYARYVRGLLSRGPPAVLRLPPACLRWRGGWQGEVYDLACIAERVRPTGQGA